MNPSYNNFGNSDSNSITSNTGANGQNSASTDSSDIILSSSTSARPRKIVIVTIIVTLAVVASFVLVGVILNNNLHSHSAQDVKKSFNIFANYVLYGEEKDSSVNTELASDYYFASCAENDCQKIYDRAKELFTDFYRRYNSLENKTLLSNNIDILENLVSSEQQMIDAIILIGKTSIIANDSLLSVYINSGEDGVRQYANDYYSLLQDSNNSYIRDFKEDLAYWLEAQISIFNLYNKNQCIINGELSRECISQKNDESLVRDLEEMLNKLTKSRESLEYYYKLPISFEYNVLSTAKVFNGEMSMGDSVEVSE